ncbi:MAG: hypothetical protein ACI8RZ_004127 [Myxococcota bacterium]|jgi:hypothetical protein
MLLLMLACRPQAPSPTETAPDTASDSGDSETIPDTTLPDGDPISTIGSWGAESMPYPEWTDAAMIDADTALMAGVTGYGVYDLPSGTLTEDYNTSRTYRVDVSDTHAIFASRIDGVRLVELSNLSGPGAVHRLDGMTHEDVSIDGDRALVAWKSDGVQILDMALNTLGWIPAESDTVALLGDIAVIGDGESVVLYDITDPTDPIERSRVEVSGRPADLDFDGTRVAVAMGGSGAGVLSVSDDILTDLGRVISPGAAMSVALDGDRLWIAAWEQVVLADLSDGAPTVIGHETPVMSAMGLAARDGTAVVADWLLVTAMTHNEGVAAPEVDTERGVVFQDATQPERVAFANHGPRDLNVTITGVPDGFSVDVESLTILPGFVDSLSLTPPGGTFGQTLLEWTTNDPDESTGSTKVAMASNVLGAPHPDFTLFGLSWPDTTLSSYTLSEYLGTVVMLAYWADY